MSKNDQQEAYEKALSANLVRVLDLQKFAEAKNGALLAFNTAWTVAIASIMIKADGPPAPFAGVLPISGTLFIVSALVALYSFMPRVNLSAFYGGEQAVSRPLNLSFYGDIARVALGDFADRIKTRYMPAEKETATSDYLNDLSQQIHVNSTIANRKYKLFKCASWVSLLSLAILSWPALIYLLKSAVRYAVELAQ